MWRKYTKVILVVAAMIASSLAASGLTPTIKVADSRPKTSLGDLFPRKMGKWAVDTNTPVVLPSADVQARLDKIYNQVLARTYIDESGYRVMLSIAYGGDQSDGLSVHRPEVCYPAQGFEVSEIKNVQMTIGGISIPVTRLLSQIASRKEPVTYWIVNGDQAVGTRSDARMVQLRYGFKGLIPDGMLIRISSIDGDSGRAFSIQQEFAEALIHAASPSLRLRIGAGTTSGAVPG